MSLVVWLPLNGDLTNQGLSNVTVTNNGATVDNNGKIGKCYNLTNGPITISNLQQSKAISIAFWFKRTVNTGTRQFMFTAWNGVTCELTTSGAPTFAIYKSSYPTITGANITDTTTWYHYCGTFSETDGMKLYINGKLIASDNNKNPIQWNTTSGQIGKYASYASMSALMNDFRIYDHALSAKEVKELSKGLVLHYRLAGPGGENFILESHKVTSGSAATGITRSYTSEGYLKVVSTSGNGNWCPVRFAKDSNVNVGNKLSVGDTYTISVEIKVENGTILPDIFINSGNSYKRLKGTIRINQWVQYSYTSVWNAPGTDYGNISLHLGFSSAIGTYYFRNFKLEKGSVATPWCPAPGDALYSVMGYNNNIEYDCSGYRRNGTKSGTITWDIDSPRYITSYKFAAGSKISASSGFPTGTNPQFTINFWFNPPSNFTYTSYADVCGLHCTTTGYSDTWCRLEACGSPAGSDWSWFRGFQPTGSNLPVENITQDAWNMITLVSDGTKMYTYTNGVNTRIMNITEWQPNGDFILGDGAGGISGKYSDLRIYATALSAEDIAELYHSAVIVDNTGKNYAYEYFEA